MEEDIPERGNWTGKLDFLLSCLGYAVGKSPNLHPNLYPNCCRLAICLIFVHCLPIYTGIFEYSLK